MPVITNVEFRQFSAKHHNGCSPIGAIAEMHLGASIVNFEIQEYHAEFYDDHYFDICRGFPHQKDGYVELDDAPGLGLELDEEKISAHSPLPKITARGGAVRGI